MRFKEKNNNINNEQEVKNPLKKVWLWVKRLGFVGFLFFLIKGLLWLLLPYLIAVGLF